jgi:hypothetical protein
MDSKIKDLGAKSTRRAINLWLTRLNMCRIIDEVN